MPGPTLLEWCTTSFSSLRNSVHQRLNSFTKPETETPPNIAAIQSLNGRTPGEKHRDLNSIVDTIVGNAEIRERFVLEDELARFSPNLVELIKIRFGMKMKIEELIVEGLKSKDIGIVRKALKCHWFFHGSRSNVSVDIFMNGIIPFVSLYTRRRIIKNLSHNLEGYEIKAESFYTKFVESYGVEENLSLLSACSEAFIFDMILKNKINLPMWLVDRLYRKYPKLVIRYLQLGNKSNVENLIDRKMHCIRINDYGDFLPKLIRKHPEEFMKLYELTPERALKLNAAQAKFFLKNCKSTIIKKPEIFLKLLPIKLVQNHLSKDEFEKMIENHLPKDIADFHLDSILPYVEGYPQNNGIHLLKEKFKKVYGKNLFDHDPCISSTRLLRTLSQRELENRVRLVLNKSHESQNDIHDLYLGFLPPSDTIYILKNKIAKTLNADERIELIRRMITCCRLYNDKENLMEVLKYFRDKHKNERNELLCWFFAFLEEEYDWKSLDQNHWSVIDDLIDNAYARGELFKDRVSLIERVLEGALRNAYVHNVSRVDKIIDLVVENKIEKCSSSWNLLKENEEREKECLEKFLRIIPEKYPEGHQVWKKQDSRFPIVFGILKSIDDYNERQKRKRKSNVSSVQQECIELENHSWLLKMTEEYFSSFLTGFRIEKILQSLKRNAPKFYESKLEELGKVHDIKSGDALKLLKNNSAKILENYEKYLSEVRNLLHFADGRENHERKLEIRAAQRFVLATKWYKDIPVKFLEQCLMEIKQEGSIHVLGMLLSGEAFEKAVEPFLPEEKQIDSKENTEIVTSFLRGMKFTNPIISIESLHWFLEGDYNKKAESTLMKLSQRTNVNECIEFAGKLMEEPKIMMKKQGIRLMNLVSTRPQYKTFLKNVWAKESNLGVRHIVSKIIFNIFIQSPDSKSWDLMKNCIDGLTLEDSEAIANLCDIEKVKPIYLSDYVEKYLQKVEEIFKTSMEIQWRTKYICLMIVSIDENLVRHLSDKVSLMILKRYFCDIDSAEISQATRIFIIQNYLLSSTKNFEERLKNVIGVLKSTMESFDRAHPKRKRFYPSNYTIQEFFSDLIKEIPCNKSQRNLKIIDSMIDCLKTNLSPRREPKAYLAMHLYRDYLVSHSPEDFGAMCSKRIRDFVTELSGNDPIPDIAYLLNNFIFHKIYREVKNPKILKMRVIEGLIRGNDHNGVLTSVQLLDPEEVKDYDERYDRIIGKLRRIKNSTIQYHLYQHLNSVKDYVDDS